MVFIYKKIVGAKTYFYLRASEREGNKVFSKDIAYLGDSIASAKEELSKLSKYKKEIEKSYRKINLFLESNHYLELAQKSKSKRDEFLEDSLYEVEACKLHYTNVFKKLDTLTQKQILDNFVVEYAFNTTSIEGNTIGLAEARDLLEEGLTPKGKTLREIYDLQNTKKVFENLDLTKDISHTLIKKVHAELLDRIDSRTEYRPIDVRITNSRFKVTPFYMVVKDLNLLIEWYTKNKQKLHPLVLAGIFHHKFEKIHPFLDGNGRTGRMLMNFILMKKNYPPIIIQKKYRSDYLDALSEADESFVSSAEKKDYEKLIKFETNELIEMYWNIFL